MQNYLNNNPVLLRRYVNIGVNIIGAALSPLNVFMRHLLVVQNINPDSIPGEKVRKELSEAMSTAFEFKHPKEYDDDFNMDWLQKKFEETRNQLTGLQLTKEKFSELTDLDNLPTNKPAQEEPVSLDPIANLKNVMEKIEKDLVKTNKPKTSNAKASKKKTSKKAPAKKITNNKIIPVSKGMTSNKTNEPIMTGKLSDVHGMFSPVKKAGVFRRVTDKREE